MSTQKAADLPVGSVVASPTLVGIKVERDPRYGNPWEMSHGGRYHDDHIDGLLARGEAQVLRVGETPFVTIEDLDHGLVQSAAGETVDLGDFTQYAKPEETP